MIDYSVIGLIEKTPPFYSIDGKSDIDATYVDGYHVNVTDSNEDTKEFEIAVKTPVRVFSGVDTVFMRFKSETEWLEFAFYNCPQYAECYEPPVLPPAE